MIRAATSAAIGSSIFCDNARFHDCRAMRKYLERHDGQLALHYLPKYAPETNPNERVTWHLLETITRNDCRAMLDELAEEVFNWLDAQPTFSLQTAHFRDHCPLAA